MFNIFGNKTDYVVPEKSQITESELNLYEEALYTVGRNVHGLVQITFKMDTGRATLSMDSQATRQMIRMLEAALDDSAEQEDE
jgi:hypothetical protein